MNTLTEDDKTLAVMYLDMFTKTFCRDKTTFDKLIFRCKECEFLDIDAKTCIIKVMARKLCPDFKDFGSMGDL